MASMPTVKKVVSTKFREDITTHGTRAESSSHNDSETSLSTLVESKDEHVQLTWRSWMVVVVTCFAQLAQVFVVAAAGQNIAFIARDLGDAELASWIIRKYREHVCIDFISTDQLFQRHLCLCKLCYHLSLADSAMFWIGNGSYPYHH